MFSCKRWRRSKRQDLKFLIQALRYVVLFRLVKCEFPLQNYIAYIFRIEHWRKLWLFFKRYYLFKDFLAVAQVPLGNMTKREFKFWISYYFSDYLELLFYQLFYYLFPFPISCKMFLFTLCWKNHLGLSHSVCLKTWFISLFRISVIQFYICRERCRKITPKYVN